MKKKLFFTIILILFLTSTILGKGNFGVHPLELTIKINDEFVQGNTSKNIIIRNVNNYSINISWYLDNPDPISWIRPNRTLIPELSWIDIKPQWQIIHPKSSKRFFIYQNIPDKEKNLNKKWEIWIVFKQVDKQFINYENVVRLLIDTPEMLKNNNHDQDFLSISFKDRNKIPLSDFLIIISVIILVFISFYVLKKKKSK